MSAGEVTAKVVADTSGFQAGMVQAANVSEAQLKRIAQYVQQASAANDAMARKAKQVAADTQRAYETVAAGARKVGESHAGAQREILVLAHELSQGNYSKFGGSLLVLGEQINIMGKLATPAGAAIGALAGVVGGAAVLMAKGAIDADRFAKQLQLTGNYAAVTEDQIAHLAEAQALVTGQTQGGARESLEAVAGSGLFSPSQVAAAARAMGDYQRLTHSTAEEALKNFQSIQDGVAKWAEEQNRSVHFLSAAEYEHIKAMEDSGNKQGAAIEALKAYAQTIESRGEPQLGALARAWHAVTQAASAAGEAIASAGRPQTIADQIDDLDKRLARMKELSRNPFLLNTRGDLPATPSNIAAVLEQRRKLVEQQSREQEQAKAAASVAATQQAAIEADKYTSGILRGAHALSERTAELKRWDAAVAAKSAAGTPMSAADVAAGRTEIMKRYASQPGDAQANQYRDLTATIKAFNAATAEEAANAAKLTEGQRFVIQVQEQLTKSGDKLTSAQRASATADAAKAAALRDVADQELRARTATMARIQADAANAQIQQQLVESVLQSGNDQANAILRQMQTIGKSADEVAKLSALQAYDDMVGKALLGADGDTVKRIQEVAAVLRGNLVTAIDAAKQAQDDFNASFSNGWKQAADEFAKTAANNAAAGRKVFEDAASGIADALANAATTGKLSFKSMINSIIADLVRMQSQKAIAGLFGGGSTFSLLDTAQGSAGASGTGSFADLFSGSFGGGYFANGLDYVPYDGFPAILHEGERVVRKQDAAAQRAGGGPTFDFSGARYSFGAGVDASGVAQAVRTGMAQTKADIYRSLNTGTRK